MISLPDDAVDGGVVDLRERGDVASLEPFDDPALPQRTVAVEGHLDEIGRERGELTLAARRRDRDVVEVLVEVEVGVLDPEWMVDAERDLGEAAAERRGQVQP